MHNNTVHISIVQDAAGRYIDGKSQNMFWNIYALNKPNQIGFIQYVSAYIAKYFRFQTFQIVSGSVTSIPR